jgi:AcrR family transcriptional regulator
MAARGQYAKGIAKRAEILDTALEVIARDGYSGATVKQLADAVGLSQNGLLHYFGSKDALFLEILKHHTTALNVAVDPEHTDFTQGLVSRILIAAAENLASAGLSQLFLSVTTEATESDHIAHAFIAHRYAATREVARDALTELQTQGRFPAHGNPAAAAALIASSYDGLQLQWLYDRSVDVLGQMAYLLDSLGIVEEPSSTDAQVAKAATKS